MKILNITMYDPCGESDAMTMTFEVQDNLDNPEQALRRAIKDFCKSEVGKSAVSYSCGAFNWGDAASSISSEHYEKYGLHVPTHQTIDVMVNHDEILCDDEDFDFE